MNGGNSRLTVQTEHITDFFFLSLFLVFQAQIQFLQSTAIWIRDDMQYRRRYSLI